MTLQYPKNFLKKNAFDGIRTRGHTDYLTPKGVKSLALYHLSYKSAQRAS